MSSVRKFLFDESFDAELPGGALPSPAEELPPEPEPEPEPPPPPPPPTFSEAELAAARKAGYAEGEKAGKAAGYGQGFGEGHTAGRKDGIEAARVENERNTNTRLAGALEKIGKGVDTLLAQRAATNAMRREQPVHLALAIARKLFPELARRGGLDEVEGLVRACITELIDEPRLVIRVAPDMADLVGEQIETLSGDHGFGPKLIVATDAKLKPGDCRIEWAEGGIERDTGRLLADIEQIAERLMAAPADA